MPTYVLLLTLTAEGRERMSRQPDSIERAEEAVSIPQTQVMGLYGVLGEYDFVTLLEAPDNEAAARFSLEFGVRAGVHITTLPAIPIGRLEASGSDRASVASAERGVGVASDPDPDTPRI
jgi:uncharacterized protein with GYD domain